MAFTKVVGAGIHTLSNITSHNIHSSGIVTATRFDGPFTNLNVTGVTTFAGDVSIGGTLTYEDVTNIDSVGLITARNGINVSAGNVTIAKDIDVDGHTNLDNVSIAGITTFTNSAGVADFRPIRLEKSGTTGASRIDFLENSTVKGGLTYSHDNNRVELIAMSGNDIVFYSGGNLTTRINSSGHVVPGTDSTYDLGLTGTRWRNVYADNLHGSGANITALNADNISSGTIPAARFGSTSAREFGVSAAGNFGQFEAHGTYTNANTEPNFWGWNFSTGNTNFPNTASSQWYRCRVSLGTSYGKGTDTSDYSMELCYPRNGREQAGQMWTRTIENGAEGSWLEVGSRPYNSIIPRANNTIDLGSSSVRWRNIYTNDLNLSNEGGVNDVDGTWGNFTIQEGEDDLFLINRRNGKKYKFNLTEVS